MKDADYMVDSLLDSNITEFKQENQLVDDICKELYYELDAVADEDIPF